MIKQKMLDRIDRELRELEFGIGYHNQRIERAKEEIEDAKTFIEGHNTAIEYWNRIREIAIVQD